MLKLKIKDFINEYNKKYGYTPKLSEWKVKDGFPCNKETLLKMYGKYNVLLESLGYKTYSYGKRRYNKQVLLKELYKSVVKYRSVDIKVLREEEKELKHRDVYTSQFGSFRNALSLCGINNNIIYLMKKYKNYNFEDPKSFLLDFLYDNNLNEKQLELITIMKKIYLEGNPPIRDAVKYKISLHSIRKEFISFTEFIILCELECGLSNKQTYESKDGHKCDSYGECLIDDLLYNNNIEHDIHVKYNNSNLISDFKVLDNIYIEYTGYIHHPNNKKYIKHLEMKRNIVKEQGNIIIEVDNTEKTTLDNFMQKLLSVMAVE